jgi:hypothetical protein
MRRDVMGKIGSFTRASQLSWEIWSRSGAPDFSKPSKLSQIISCPLLRFSAFCHQHFARTIAESIRLLCSGYLAIFLADFCEDSAAYCRYSIGKIRMQGDQVTSSDLSKIWAVAPNPRI